MNIIGVDTGRYGVKVYYSGGYFWFRSRLGEYRNFEFDDERGEDDVIGEFEGRKFTAGSLVRESDWCSSLMTENKIHQDTVILTLIAIAKASKSSDIGLVTNLPINLHQRDKQRLKRTLEGLKSISINGVERRFNINCEIAPEGSGIFKYAGPGIVHGLNVGSRTVNAITFEDGKKIGRLSDTLPFGMETQKSNDMAGMAREIAGRIGGMKWMDDEPIYLCGGGSPLVANELKRYYPNACLTPNPLYTDAEAFYRIAREIYDR